MTKKNEGYLLVVCLVICLTGVFLLYGLEVEFAAQIAYISQTVTYLTGLATLFLAWRRIDHKIPSKRKNTDEH